MRLTTAERDYLDASVARRDEQVEAESAGRAAREAGLTREAARGWWTLVAVVAALATTAAAILIVGRNDSPKVALIVLAGGGGTIDELITIGLERAGREFGFEPIVLHAVRSRISRPRSDRWPSRGPTSCCSPM